MDINLIVIDWIYFYVLRVKYWVIKWWQVFIFGLFFYHTAVKWYELDLAVSAEIQPFISVSSFVCILNLQSFPDVKSKLDVTISVHVYSVQKAELKDSAPLYSTDYDAMKENLKNCNKYVTSVFIL